MHAYMCIQRYIYIYMWIFQFLSWSVSKKMRLEISRGNLLSEFSFKPRRSYEGSCLTWLSVMKPWDPSGSRLCLGGMHSVYSPDRSVCVYLRVQRYGFMYLYLYTFSCPILYAYAIGFKVPFLMSPTHPSLRYESLSPSPSQEVAACGMKACFVANLRLAAWGIRWKAVNTKHS